MLVCLATTRIFGTHCICHWSSSRPFKDTGDGGLARPYHNSVLTGIFGFDRILLQVIQGYASIVAPLTSLLQKDNFHWGVEAQTAFDNLKQAMTQAPVLALSDFSTPFMLETNALCLAMGVVLMQYGHPLAFFNKAFCPCLQRSSTFILTIPNFTFHDALHRHFLTNDSFQEKVQQVTLEPNSHPDFKIHNGSLFFQNKIWLNTENLFLSSLMEEFHSTPLGGHLGFAKTLHRLQANIYWPNMRKDMRQFVRKCSTCQQVKYEPKRPAGLLPPLPILSSPWKELSLDFIIGLPPSQGYTTILVVVDRFTKGAHFGALASHYTTHKVAFLFQDMVGKLHGFPRSLVSNQDPSLLGAFGENCSPFVARSYV